MKLKTLKDFDVNGEFIKTKELKQEVIKWVKKHKVMAMKTDLVENWIKHFFNLTKEDLK